MLTIDPWKTKNGGQLTCEWWIAKLSKGADLASEEPGGPAAAEESAPGTVGVATTAPGRGHSSGADSSGPVSEEQFAEMWHPKTPQVMREMGRAIFNRVVSQFGIAESRRAAAIALGAIDQIRQEFGGENIYFSRGHFELSDQIKAAVAARYNGRNLMEIAAELGVSSRRVQQMVEEVRRTRQRKSQRSAHPLQGPTPKHSSDGGASLAKATPAAKKRALKTTLPNTDHPWAKK